MTTTTTGPRTVSRSSTRQIAALREAMTRCYSHSLAGNFTAQPCDPARAWAALSASRDARLRDNGDGSCTVRIHGNLWYDLRPRRAPADLAALLASFRHYPPEPNTAGSPRWLCTFPVTPHRGLIALGSDNGRTFAATLHRGCLAEVDAARPDSPADAQSADEAAERRDSEMFGAPEAEVTGTPEFERHLAEAIAALPADEARQVVYRYPAGLAGTGEFAVWHIGSSAVTVYMPEGTERQRITLDAPGRAAADAAAASYREVVSADESAGLYPPA